MIAFAAIIWLVKLALKCRGHISGTFRWYIDVEMELIFAVKWSKCIVRHGASHFGMLLFNGMAIVSV